MSTQSVNVMDIKIDRMILSQFQAPLFLDYARLKIINRLGLTKRKIYTVLTPGLPLRYNGPFTSGLHNFNLG